jgi:hypothetical protein
MGYLLQCLVLVAACCCLVWGDDDPFPQGRVLTVKIDMLPKDWQTMINNPNEDEYFPANITYDGTFVSNVGLKIKGSSSRRGAIQGGQNRFSFRLKANKFVSGQKVRGEKKLNFNNGFKDPSFLHETLSYGIMANYISSSATSFGDMTVAGNHLGLYTIVEQVDETYLKSRYSYSKGDLYRVGVPDGYCDYDGDSFDDCTSTELRTNEDDSDGQAYVTMVKTLNENLPAIDTAMNVNEVLYHLACQISFVNLDSAAGDGNNIYWYETVGDSGAPVMELIPWDQNEAFGTFGCHFPNFGMGGGAHHGGFKQQGFHQGPPPGGDDPFQFGGEPFGIPLPTDNGRHHGNHDGTHNNFHENARPLVKQTRQGPPPPDSGDLTDLDVYTPCNSTASQLFNLLIPAYKADYTAALNAVVSGPMLPATINPSITTYADMIRPFVYADTTKFFTDTDFECSVRTLSDPARPRNCGRTDSLQDWIDRRVESVNKQIGNTR